LVTTPRGSVCKMTILDVCLYCDWETKSVYKIMSDKLSTPLDEFKDRELEVITLMANGLSNREIADQLFVTVNTVRWYNKQIYSKLGTSRRTEAIALAREMGLIEDDDTSDSKSISTKLPPLPQTTGPFVGRDDDIKEIVELLENPDIRLVSIIATGGMGKSRLSLETGHSVQKQYTHGAIFIDLTAIRNPDNIAQYTAVTIGLEISGDRNPEDVLFDYCRDKEILLIFDNAEHVLAGAPLLSGILKHAPKIKIIVTSREKLNLRAETPYYLEPITKHGAKLFIEVASLMHPTVEFTDEDTPHINKILELIGGMPLAVVLTSTWLDVLSLPEIVEEVQNNLDFLEAEMADVPDRQRSIRAVIEPTWKRLSDDDKHAFMCTSVFRGGFTRETFQQVTGASIRTLQTLLNRSLISTGYGRRYNLHPLIRQYAREQLVVHHLLDDAKNAHLATYTTYTQTHAKRMYEGYYLESLDALESEADNIRGALEWSLQGNNVEHGVDITLALGEFWLIRSRTQEAIAYVELALKLSQHPMLLYWYSEYLNRLGRIDSSIDYAQRLIQYAELAQDDELLAYAKIQVGYLKDTKIEAAPLFESALKHAMKTGNQNLIATCHSYLALVSDKSPETEETHLQQALEIFETLGDLRGISRVTNNLAIRYYGEPKKQEDAKELMDYSLRLKREIRDRAGEARRLTTMSMWAMEEEEFEQAQQWLSESRQICEELGERDRLSYTLTTEGLLYLLMTDFQQAQATLERSLQVHIEVKDYHGIVDIYGFLCQIHLLQNNLNDAYLSIEKGLEHFKKEITSPFMIIIAYASYLWHTQDITTCLPLVAFISQQQLKVYSGSEKIINQYFLQPLIYRVQQHVGDETWQQAVSETQDLTLEQVTQAIIDTVHAN